jgi:hypothetical protein
VLERHPVMIRHPRSRERIGCRGPPTALRSESSDSTFCLWTSNVSTQTHRFASHESAPLIDSHSRSKQPHGIQCHAFGGSRLGSRPRREPYAPERSSLSWVRISAWRRPQMNAPGGPSILRQPRDEVQRAPFRRNVCSGR